MLYVRVISHLDSRKFADSCSVQRSKSDSGNNDRTTGTKRTQLSSRIVGFSLACKNLGISSRDIGNCYYPGSANADVNAIFLDRI